MSATFSVKVSDYEGPLDLILALIEERKLLISDVSISAIADAFLAYVSEHGGFPVSEAAHFVAVAATLLLLKSRSLLPVLMLTSEEEGDIKDLEQRLKLLSIIKTVAQSLSALKGRLYFGSGVRSVEPIFVPPPDMTLQSLAAAANSAIVSAPRPQIRDEVEVRKVLSLDEMIERLTARIQSALTMSFRDFSQGASDPREIVVGFLAMLELVKRGFAEVRQQQHFDEITIEYAGAAGTPRYE